MTSPVSHPDPRLGAAEARLRWTLASLLAAGLGLRALLVSFAENRLDADEATVAVMALDILEGKALPFFFYHQAYNGGAAIEAYLGAGVFAIVGASEIALKLALGGLWLCAALLFAGLCRRALPARNACLSVLVFCVGTPFLLEWSVKARGGYNETLLFSVLLLWLAHPPAALQKRLWLQASSFGAAAGLGLWASEMLLPMLPCAAAWLLARRQQGERRRSAFWMAIGLGIGLAPLFVYNLTHAGSHLAQSALLGLVTGEPSQPLSMELLWKSFAFVLSPVQWLLIAGLGVAAVRITRQRRPMGLAHVLLLHTLLFTAGYWLAGTRFLPEVAPSRLLYALYPGASVLLAYAVVWEPGSSSWRRGASIAAIAVWLVGVLTSSALWAASGLPRESGSWRASWSLVDGPGLYRVLSESEVETAIVSYWTRWPLEFAARVEKRRNPAAAALRVSMSPQGLPQTRSGAFALLAGTPLANQVAASLLRQGIDFRRSRWTDFVIFSGLDTARLDAGLGLPTVLDRGAWLDPPAEPDGFN